MKQKIEAIPDPTIDPGQAELTTFPDWNHGHEFVIRGDEEELTVMALKLQAQDARSAKRMSRRHIATAAIEAVESPVKSVTHKLGSMAREHSTQRQVAKFDRKHGTDLLGELAERKRLERVLAMRQAIGLSAVDTCQKHRHAIASIR